MTSTDQQTDRQPSYEDLAVENYEKRIIIKYLEEENRKLRDEKHKLNNAQYLQRNVKAEPNDSSTGNPLKRANFGGDLSSAKRPRISQDAGDNETHNSDLPQQELDKLNQENAELKSQLDESNQKAIALEQKFAESNERVKAADEQNVSLSQLVADSKQEIDALKAELDKSKQEVVELKSKVASSNVDGLKAELEKSKQEATNSQAQLKQTKEENRELKKQISEVARQHDEIVDDFVAQAKSMMAAKRFEDALESYHKAIAVEGVGCKDAKRFGAYWCGVALCWGIGMSKYEKALEAVKNAIKFDSSNPEFHYVQGIYHKYLGNRSEALESLHQSIRLNPGHANAKNLLSKTETE